MTIQELPKRRKIEWNDVDYPGLWDSLEEQKTANGKGSVTKFVLEKLLELGKPESSIETMSRRVATLQKSIGDKLMLMFPALLAELEIPNLEVEAREVRDKKERIARPKSKGQIPAIEAALKNYFIKNRLQTVYRDRQLSVSLEKIENYCDYLRLTFDLLGQD